jgi:Fe-S-cluster containining protein
MSFNLRWRFFREDEYFLFTLVMRRSYAHFSTVTVLYIILNVIISFIGAKALDNARFSHCRTLGRGISSRQELSPRLMVASPDFDSQILRKVDKWACIKDCGACCKLGPLESRPDLPEYLTEDELTLYQSMIGEDEFCKHFDQKAKMCTIYDQRPSFCVVKPEKMKVMFDIDQEEINDFCAFCCREQISDHYGEESDVMERFEEVIASLRGDDERDEEERSEGEIDPNDGGKWVSL